MRPTWIFYDLPGKSLNLRAAGLRRGMTIILCLALLLAATACNDSAAPKRGDEAESAAPANAMRLDTVPVMGALREGANKDAVRMSRAMLQSNAESIAPADEAVLYYVIATAYDRLGGRDTASLYSQRALTAWRRAGAPAGALQLEAAHLALKTQLRSAQSGYAEPFFGHVLELSKTLYGAESAEYAAAAVEYAGWLTEQRREQIALDQLKEAHRIYTVLDSTAAAARCLQLQGVAMFRAGDLRSAGEIFDEVYKVRRELYSGDHVEVAESLNSRGIIAFADKRYDDAAENFGQAANMHANLHGDTDAGLIDILQNLRSSYERLGQSSKAAAINEHLERIQKAQES